MDRVRSGCLRCSTAQNTPRIRRSVTHNRAVRPVAALCAACCRRSRTQHVARNPLQNTEHVAHSQAWMTIDRGVTAPGWEVGLWCGRTEPEADAGLLPDKSRARGRSREPGIVSDWMAGMAIALKDLVRE